MGRPTASRHAATAASFATTRADRQDAHRAARPQVSQRHLRRQRRAVDPVRRDLGLHRQALLVRRAEDGHDRDGAGQPAGLSGQHQQLAPTATTGCRWSACAARRSIWLGRCRASAAAWPSACRADEWLFPNINTGCVLKFNEQGEVLETLWDLGGVNHPMITSMREHRGYLYLGGIMNNRIGRYKIPGRRSRFRPVRAALGPASVIARAQAPGPNDCSAAATAAISVPVFDGALKPNRLTRAGGGGRRTRCARGSGKRRQVALRRRRRPRAALRRRRGDSQWHSARSTRSPRWPACLAAVSRSRSTAREVRVIGGPARRPKLDRRGRHGALNAVNALCATPTAACWQRTARRPQPSERWWHDLMELGRSGRLPRIRPRRRQRARDCRRARAMPSALLRPVTTAGCARAGRHRVVQMAERTGGRAVLEPAARLPVAHRARAGRRLLAHRLHLPHPAGRVRASRDGLSQAHDEGDRSAILDRAGAAPRATPSWSRCRARTSR